MGKRRSIFFRNADDDRDLGFGSRVLEQSNQRFLNRDGSYNISRMGLPFLQSLNLYHTLLTMSWGSFFLLLIGWYFGVNLLFALGYYLCGPEALTGTTAASESDRFLESFFFSVQTLATIGYGGLSPSGVVANVLVTVQALIGGLGFALATGLVFARFSRPSAKILFSNQAIIAPYREITAFEFRIVNSSSNELVDVDATVVLSRIEEHDGKRTRKFHTLPLERDRVRFFPLHWVIVHPIDQASPLYGTTEHDLRAADAEFLILLSATDETSSQHVHSRLSYKHDEVVWGAKFADIFNADGRGMGIDVRRLHDIERTSL